MVYKRTDRMYGAYSYGTSAFEPYFSGRFTNDAAYVYDCPPEKLQQKEKKESNSRESSFSRLLSAKRLFLLREKDIASRARSLKFKSRK